VRLLLDECVSRLLKSSFAGYGYECLTVPEVGLAGKKNGDLLLLAEGKFDVFITIDKNIRYQQNLTGRKIAVLIIRAKSSEINDLLQQLPACVAALRNIQPGQVIQVDSATNPYPAEADAT
jgi:predicted nuclease of predicted toxin-antitoxin system